MNSSSEAKKYWKKRYINNQTGWDIGYISTPLRTYFETLKNKDISILIPGAGNSYEAEYLFSRGFKNVFVLDIANEPLKNFKLRLPNFPKTQLINDDFFCHAGNYDLIIEQTFFCAIHPSLRVNYVNKMADLLKPDGKLVGLLFNTQLHNDHPPYGGSKSEYNTLFSTKFNLDIIETAYNSIKPREGKELFITFTPK